MLKRKGNIIKAMLVSALILLMCFNNIYAIEMSGECSEGSVVLTFENPQKGLGTTVWFFDKKIEKTEFITAELLKEHLVYTCMPEEGRVEFELPDNARKGVYTAVVGSSALGEALENRICYFVNSSEDEEIAVRDEINGSQTADGLFECIASYNDYLYTYELNYISGLKDLFFDAFKTLKPISSINDIEQIIETTRFYDMVRTGTPPEIADIAQENSDMLCAREDFKNNILACAEAFCRLRGIKGVKTESISDIKSAFEEATAVAMFNATDAADIFEVLNDYKETMGIDVSKLSGLNGEQLYTFKKNIKNIDCIDAKDVKKSFDESIAKAKEKKPESGGGFVGGGGGGGGGGLGGGKTKGSLNGGFISSASDNIGNKLAKKTDFNDVSSVAWALEAIEYLSYNKVINGDGNGNFRPNDSITREEFLKCVIAAFDIQLSEHSSKFTDIPDDHWSKPYVVAGLENKIVNGISESEFGAGLNITRQDVAVILKRACDVKYITFDKKGDIIDFSDYYDVADYALFAVDDLVRSGIINGFEDGSIKPLKLVTRAEAAKLIYECIKNK